MKTELDVVIPNRNYGEYLVQAVESVLNQKDADVHVVIVDDASTDDSNSVAAAMAGDRVTHIQFLEHRGLSKARNIGLQECHRPWVAFLDSDDVWPSDRTKCLAEALGSQQETIAFGTAHEFADDPTMPNPEPRETGLHLQSGMIPRSVMERVGQFDETLTYGANLDWVARARSMGVSMINVEAVALERRIHSRNMAREIPSNPQDFLAIVRRHRAAR